MCSTAAREFGAADKGPAVVPGDLKASLLIEAIRYEKKNVAMPPKKSGGNLADEVITDFEKWVQMEAPDPREGAAKLATMQDVWATAKVGGLGNRQKGDGAAGERCRVAAERH